MKTLKFISIFLFLLVLLNNSVAQEYLTLEECIAIAQENSLEIKKTILSEKSAEISLKQAKQQMLPSLNASSSLSYNVGRRIDPTTNSYLSQSFLSQAINLNSGVILYNGNKLRNGIKKAKYDIEASKEDLSQIKRDVSLHVANTYLSILFAEENLDNSKNQYNSTNEQLSKIKKLIDVGMQPSSASLNLEAQLLSDKQKIITSENEIEKLYLNLKNILLLDDSKRIKVVVPKIDFENENDFDLLSISEIHSSALQHYPAYSAAKYRVESKMLQERISKASILPSVSFGGGLSTNYADKAKEVVGYNNKIRESIFIINNQEVNVGVPYIEPITSNQKYGSQIENNLGFGVALQVSIPIYNNYSAKGMIQRAKLDLESSKISQEQVEQGLKTKVQLALAEAKGAKAQYFASKKAFDAQKAAFKNAKLQNEVGAIGSYDFLNAKLMFERSQTSLLISKYQYIFKTIILDFYLGKNISFN